MALHLTMHKLLAHMRSVEASDLHLKVGMPPIYRVGGELRMPPTVPPLSEHDTARLIGEIIPDHMAEKLKTSGDADFSTFQSVDEPAGESGDSPVLHAKKQERFRCNVFRSGGHLHAAIRRVKPDIPTFESLNLPPIYRKIADETHEGLCLVVGVTGCGKSTTLACMLERVNEARSENIITIEDPVEYHIHPKRSVVSQREIGIDVSTYAEALRYVVRQDPDVIFIGELRDHDTVLAAIQAAETGHLVFGSLHTADTMQTFSRIIEFFPQVEHGFVRSALSNSIKAVCAQRLLPGADGGMVPATEVLLSNPTVRETIRDGRDTDIPAIVNASIADGMRTFTHSLAELVEKEMVTTQVALEYAPNRDALKSRLKGVQVKESMLVNRVGG
jgi:twitching motility protein PilT